MSELKLLPCPFCGGETKTSETTTDKENKFEFGWIGCQECQVFIDYINNQRGKREAVAAWNRRAQPENEPLTLEELRQMDGEPVWVQELPPYTTAGHKVLAAPAVNEYGDICFDGGDCYAPYDYGKTWLAYRTKPERSEG